MAKARENQDLPFYRVRDLLKKVLEKSGSYLSSKDLMDFGIKLSSMDIETGVSEDSGPQFCHLLPSDEFTELFRKRVSIDHWPDDYEDDEDDMPDNREDPFSAAYGVRLLLDKCLGADYDKEALTYESQHRTRG